MVEYKKNKEGVLVANAGNLSLKIERVGTKWRASAVTDLDGFRNKAVFADEYLQFSLAQKYLEDFVVDWETFLVYLSGFQEGMRTAIGEYVSPERVWLKYKMKGG